MPTYVLPQVLVFQDFTRVPSAVANPLRAHISGPHAYLLRYADDDERDKGRLGFYDPLLANSYPWPDRPAGGLVDQSYTKLWMKDALLKYFEDTISAGSTITKVSGYNNRIRSASISFATNGDYARSGSLLRNVQPGDVVKVRGLDGDSNSITLWTYVKRLIGDVVGAEVGAASTDTENPATQSASSSYVQVAGAENCITLSLNHASYDGTPTGDISEVYDIVVTQSSAGGDLTTAKLRVLSGSGRDDQTDVTPSAAASATEIGTRGLLVTFNVGSGSACSDSAEADGVSPDDLIAGQRFQVTVHQAFTKPVPTSGGTYAGSNDTTYIVEVTRGGKYASAVKPQIKVTTTTGVDLSGPTTVTAASTAFDIGTQGVTISFTGTALSKGDRYFVECAAEAAGAMKTIELGNNLDTEIAAASEVDVTLFIRKPLLQVPRNRTGFAPLTNWDMSETEITVNDGIVGFDAEWVDGGVPQPLDVVSEASKEYGEMFVEYRAWLPDLAHEIGTIRDVGSLDDLISGPIDPDNPLKWGVFKALENANGTEVKYSSVIDPEDPDDWVDVLELCLGRDDVYGLVPLTRNRTVLDLYAAHVKSQSTPEQGLWRVLWTNLEGVPVIPVVHAGSTIPGHTEATTDDGLVCKCVIEDDPLTSGSQYTIFRCTSGNSDFIKLGVRAGDTIRALYTGDGFGNYEYQEFTVDEVQAEEQIRALTGPDAPLSVAAKIEIWRNLSATEEASVLAVNAGSWGDRRIRATWPDTIESSGTVMQGYFLNCSLAGLRSGVLPHQGMTRLEIVGYSAVPRTIDKFNRAQLDTLAYAGTWIVTQDRFSGKVFTRHALTTGNYTDINSREEALTSNVDSISYRFKDFFSPYIGVTNVTPTMQARLELEIGKLIRVLQTEAKSVELGGQLIDATVLEFGPHLLLKDRYVLALDCAVPYPFNNMEIHLIV